MFGTATGFDATGFVCEDDTDAIIRRRWPSEFHLIHPKTILSAASPSSTMRGVRLAMCPYIPGLRTKKRPN